ncbi:hypothetical protein K1719_032896 [Acacia pycnantha]|nr:hypothetical protein K1719_032896 [Acacia pycnantha]
MLFIRAIGRRTKRSYKRLLLLPNLTPQEFSSEINEAVMKAFVKGATCPRRKARGLKQGERSENPEQGEESAKREAEEQRTGWSEKEEAQKEIAHYALAQIQPRVVSFEEQVLIIREKLAELYESEKEWSTAAQMLSGIDLDSGMRLIDDTFRLSKCVQIARLYLEDDDVVNAEAFINKASFLVSNSQQENTHPLLNPVVKY